MIRGIGGFGGAVVMAPVDFGRPGVGPGVVRVPPLVGGDPVWVTPCRLGDAVVTPGTTSVGVTRRLVVVTQGDAPSVVAPRADVAKTLSLKLITVAPDQTTYWPNEVVRIAVFLPGGPGVDLAVTLTPKGGTPRDLGTHRTDANGVLHLPLLDGREAPLTLGEYQVDVKTTDGGRAASAQFSVVEGALGAVSFAVPWQKATTQPIPLGGWWMAVRGVPSGERWGHGLVIHNQLLVMGAPYTGPATVVSRCYLPGCNGVLIDSQTVEVEQGVLKADLKTANHSGPFEVEIKTPHGTLRHRFDQSGHVERRMVPVSRGLGAPFAVGVSPYEGTTPLPGRPLFWERQESTGDDPLLLAHIVAPKGEAMLTAQRRVERVAAFVYALTPEAGTFVPRPVLGIPAVLEPGMGIKIPIAGPYSLLVVAGFTEEGRFFEGHSLVFTPGGLGVAVRVPPRAAPLDEIPVELTATDGDGVRLKGVSGVLTVYDSRVEHPDPCRGLVAGLGQAVRQTADGLASLEVPDGIASYGAMLGGVEGIDDPTILVRRSFAPATRRVTMGRLGAAGSSGGGTGCDDPPEGEAPEEGVLREGVLRVVSQLRVEVGPDGFVRVPVPLGPQTGNYRAEFAALYGLDFATDRAQVDAQREAAAEAILPVLLVPGARLRVPVTATNVTGAPVTFRASGGGLAVAVERPIAAPREEVILDLTGPSGKVEPLRLEMRDSGGTLLDLRELPVRRAGSFAAIRSRLAFGDGTSEVVVAPGERVAVYGRVGPLLSGMVAPIVTTTASWFPHAEAVAANAAVDARLLQAIERGLIDGAGQRDHLAAQATLLVSDLERRFFLPTTGLFVPYAGMDEGNSLWSAWVVRHLQGVVESLEGSVDNSLRATAARARGLVQRVHATLMARGESVPELAGYDPAQGGRDVMVIRSPGGYEYRILTDDAVVRWIRQEWFPLLGDTDGDLFEALTKLSDAARLLDAYARIGDLPYLIQLAKALWHGGMEDTGDQLRFHQLFATIAHGMVRTQEPGLIQGPALSGGIYGQPQALVRFLELLLMMDDRERSGERRRPAQVVRLAAEDGSSLAEQRLPLEGTTPHLIEPVDVPRRLRIPEFAAVLLEGRVTGEMTDYLNAPSFFSVQLDDRTLRVGGQTTLTITLNPEEDPLEYQAIVVAPATAGIQQTGDILLDWRGDPLHGQRATGGTTIQMVAVPFRGARTLQLNLEGVLAGNSPGIVLVRHLHQPSKIAAVPIEELVVD